MSRKLNKNTIKPVIRYVKTHVNSGYYKFYHFTLDYYNSKPSFQGGTAYDLDGCYQLPTGSIGYTGTYLDNIASGEPFDEYALDLETGAVIDLKSKLTVMRVNYNV